MKSPTYILKKPHLERQYKEEYSNHLNNIKKIIERKVDVNKKYSDAYGLLTMINKNHQIAFRFRENQLQINLARENRSLSNKVLDVKSFNYSKLSLEKCQSSTYFQRPMVKKEQQRIYYENLSLATRIVGSLPNIKKNEHDEQYKKHLNDLKSLKKFHTDSSYLTPRVSTSDHKHQQYTLLTSRTQKSSGIVYQIQFENINFKNIIIAEKNDNKYFLEIFLGESQIQRTIPLLFQEFQHITLQLFIKANQFEKEILIKVWKSKHNMEVFIGQNQISIQHIKSMLDFNIKGEQYEDIAIEKCNNYTIIKWYQELVLTKANDRQVVCGLVRTKFQAYYQLSKKLQIIQNNRESFLNDNGNVSVLIRDDQVEKNLEDVLQPHKTDSEGATNQIQSDQISR